MGSFVLGRSCQFDCKIRDILTIVSVLFFGKNGVLYILRERSDNEKVFKPRIPYRKGGGI